LALELFPKKTEKLWFFEVARWRFGGEHIWVQDARLLLTWISGLIEASMPLFTVTAAVLAAALGADKAVRLEPALQEYVEARATEFGRIPEERREQLIEIARFVQTRAESDRPARLTFICTHNSRRSHLAQIWAKVAATYYGVGGVETFSGGTEATAFNPRAVNALKRAGFSISTSEPDRTNPRYEVRFDNNGPSMQCFSKVYKEDPNPQKDFCAVMTCSQADQSCPIVAGAALRVAVPYEDPKAFDGTPEETEKYDERCQQIAREMLYIFSKV
jgi:protein-tyrosine-phosphatase